MVLLLEFFLEISFLADFVLVLEVFDWHEKYLLFLDETADLVVLGVDNFLLIVNDFFFFKLIDFNFEGINFFLFCDNVFLLTEVIDLAFLGIDFFLLLDVVLFFFY